MRTRKIVFVALLTAIALTIFIVEAQIPPIVPIPGIKLGLANVVTLFTLMTLGKKEAFAVLTLRVILGNIAAGSVVSFFYSYAGGLLCFLAMCVCLRFIKKDLLWCISIFGAIFHNIGQLATALVITGTVQILWYLPVLTISAVITGAFTGLLTQVILKHGNGLIKRMTKRLR